MTLPPTPRRPLWRRAVKLVFFVAAAGAGVWAVSGKTDELSGASGYFTHLDWGWIAVAIGAEALSYLSFAQLQRRLLGAGSVKVPMGPMTAITFAGNAIQNSLPAGVVISAAFAFRQYRRYGADDVLCSWVVVAMTVLSLMSLTALAATGLALAATAGSALDLAGVIIGTVAVMVLLGVGWRQRTWLIDRSESGVRLAQRLVHRPSGDAHELVVEVRQRLGAITPTRRDWGFAATMALTNWLFDMACLAVAFVAVHSDVPWRGLLLAYAAAQLASNLPITPGGLGVVEGSLTLALVAFGGLEASTVAAVLVYRLMSFWLVLPIGWGSWGTITVMARRRADRSGAATVPVLAGEPA